jgi:hypothetical protein
MVQSLAADFILQLRYALSDAAGCHILRIQEQNALANVASCDWTLERIADNINLNDPQEAFNNVAVGLPNVSAAFALATQQFGLTKASQVAKKKAANVRTQQLAKKSQLTLPKFRKLSQEEIDFQANFNDDVDWTAILLSSTTPLDLERRGGVNA